MIYLVRHGETAWNREGRMQGQLDSRLTARGAAQARRIGQTLRALIDQGDGYSMVASPLGRARRSASIICDALGRDAGAFATDDRLKEIGWGEWEGLTHDEIEARHPGELARRRRDLWCYAPRGGESYEAVAARVQDWLDEIASGQRLIVVAHGTMGRVLRGLYANLPIPELVALERPQDALFRLDGGEVVRIEAGPVG